LIDEHLDDVEVRERFRLEKHKGVKRSGIAGSKRGRSTSKKSRGRGSSTKQPRALTRT
jgi:hypothetical protein